MKKNSIFGLLILICSICFSAVPQKNVNEGMEIINKGLFDKQRGNHKKALELFLYCFDNAGDFGEKFLNVKNSFLMIYLEQMLAEYSPTQDALDSRLIAILENIEKGIFKVEDLDSIYELSKLLNKSELVYTSFKKADRAKFTQNEFSKLVWEIYPILYDKEEFTIMYRNVDILKKIKMSVKNIREMADFAKPLAINTFKGKLEKYKKIFEFNDDKVALKELKEIIKTLE